MFIISCWLSARRTFKPKRSGACFENTYMKPGQKKETGHNILNVFSRSTVELVAPNFFFLGRFRLLTVGIYYFVNDHYECSNGRETATFFLYNIYLNYSLTCPLHTVFKGHGTEASFFCFHIDQPHRIHTQIPSSFFDIPIR
jgi:hypothetical protein